MPRKTVLSLVVGVCLSLAATAAVASPSSRPNFDVTVRVLDADGRVASADELQSIGQYDVDDMGGTEIPTRDGVAHFDTSPGRHNYYATLTSPRAPHTTFLSLVNVAADKATTLTLDARKATTAHVSVPARDARLLQAAVSLCYGPSPVDNRCWQTYGATASSLDDIAFSPTAGRLRTPQPLRLTVQALFAGPSPATSADVYHVAARATDLIPRNPTWQLRDDQFATVPTTYYAQRPGAVATIEHWGSKEGAGGYGTLTEQVTLPERRVEHYQAGVLWARRLSVADASADAGFGDVVSYRPGSAPAEGWNQAVRGPGLAPRDQRPSMNQLVPQVSRENSANGDAIRGLPDLYSDPQRRFRAYDDASAEYALYEDGVKLPLAPRTHRWTTRKARARYRLTAHLRTTGTADVLSSDVTAEWTFNSAHGGTPTTILPMNAITLRPEVDWNNSAPADRPTTISLDAYRQLGAAPSPVRELTLRYCYDDGGVWQQAPVTREGEHGTAVLPAPPAGSHPSYVALDVFARTADGGTVRERILRAYRIG